MYEINSKSSTPIYMQIYEQAIEAIRIGVLSEGDKMQSIRELAKVLGVSVKTTKSAYEQLSLEGFITARDRSGYYVNQFDHEYEPKQDLDPVIPINRTEYRNLGNAKDSFDEENYYRIVNSIVKSSQNLGKESAINGEKNLQEEIIKFVGKYRNVKAHPNQVIISNNTRTLLFMILNLIDEPMIAFEEPGYEKAERLFKAHNIPCYPITAEESGINMDKLIASSANIVYTTPTHQYPTGSIMPINKRLSILDWAVKNNAYLIEDDYSGVLRYTGNPVPSIQSLDQFNRVIYIGSFQTLMTPSIKLSFMILPPELLIKFESIKKRFDHTVSKLTQLAVAEFMHNGHFDRHIKRLRTSLAKKVEIVVNELEKLNVSYTDFQAGTYVLVHLSDDEIIKVIERGKEINISLIPYRKNGFVLFNYRGIEDVEIVDVIKYIFTKKG